MADTRGLYRTTVVIWSRYPGDTVELVGLAQQATDGDAYCAKQESVFCDDPFGDPDAPSQEFFVDVLEWEEYLEHVVELAGELQLTRTEAVAVADELLAGRRAYDSGDLTAEQVVACAGKLRLRSPQALADE